MAKYYPAAMHNITRALGDVHYPITKEELVEQLGSTEVQMDFDKSVVLADIIKDTPLDTYSCAAELYNNMTCVLW